MQQHEYKYGKRQSKWKCSINESVVTQNSMVPKTLPHLPLFIFHAWSRSFHRLFDCRFRVHDARGFIMKRILFRFNEDGSTTSDASGFEGQECIHKTEEALKGLDPQLVKRMLKAEAYVKTETKTTVKI